MSDLTKRLCRPGYDLQKEQAIQESIIEIARLRAKIEAMEQQEPVAWMSSRNGFIVKDNKNHDYNLPLYIAPGAKGEEKHERTE